MEKCNTNVFTNTTKTKLMVNESTVKGDLSWDNVLCFSGLLVFTVLVRGWYSTLQCGCLLSKQFTGTAQMTLGVCMYS